MGIIFSENKILYNFPATIMRIKFISCNYGKYPFKAASVMILSSFLLCKILIAFLNPIKADMKKSENADKNLCDFSY